MVLVSRVESLATRQVIPYGVGSMVWRVWGDGRPLVLLHGASGSWTHWIRNISPLAARFRVIVPDMPGFGESDTPPVQRDLDFRMVAGAGHWVIYEAADQVNAALLDMLMEGETARPP